MLCKFFLQQTGTVAAGALPAYALPATNLAIIVGSGCRDEAMLFLVDIAPHNSMDNDVPVKIKNLTILQPLPSRGLA